MIPGQRPRKFSRGVYFRGKDLNRENSENFHVYSMWCGHDCFTVSGTGRRGDDPTQSEQGWRCMYDAGRMDI